MTRRSLSIERRPHRFPPRETWPNDDPECIAWKCYACGEWVSELQPRTPCCVDWRKQSLCRRVVNAWKELVNA